MEEFALPPSDEPFDFRRQAATYGRYRRDYSPALYDAIAARTGSAAGRRALDLGCGTGFVLRSLVSRGWRVLGADFSAPMLAEAQRADPAGALVQTRGEALAVRSASVDLLTCGTAFHWLAPMPALAEIVRVLVPGGWVALFWRYALPNQPPGEAPMELVGDVLRRFVPTVPAGDFVVHQPEPFEGSRLVPETVEILDGALAFTPEEFQGYVATVEWLRRLAGPHHAAFVDAVGVALAERWPAGVLERTREYLFLARKPPGP